MADEAATSTRVTPGDAVRVAVGDAHAFLHYVGRHGAYGDVVVIGPKTRDPFGPAAFSGGYVGFYPVKLAAAQGLVDLVGRADPPPMPARFRRPGKIEGTRVLSWLVDAEGGPVVRRTLTPEELALPIVYLWNHAMLVERIAEGWHPARPDGAPGLDGAPSR